jgi:hypothetical protein
MQLNGTDRLQEELFDPETGAVASKIAAPQQHVVDRRHQRNGQSKPKQEKCQGAPAPKTCAKVSQGNGVKPPPKPAPVRQQRARANGTDGHSLKPVRSISGLTVADFLYDR